MAVLKLILLWFYEGLNYDFLFMIFLKVDTFLITFKTRNPTQIYLTRLTWPNSPTQTTRNLKNTPISHLPKLCPRLYSCEILQNEPYSVVNTDLCDCRFLLGKSSHHQKIVEVGLLSHLMLLDHCRWVNFISEHQFFLPSNFLIES